ncbi:glucosaminidase domain-containing protein [Endozoicomonas gorgoniicola]|uniref:Glucosaminidase domain-containing protein n=1 Tax=Endozoicomonas gorgoniicola TaxID=1234144 RepID=A0ABT3MQ59_9GAMM|nr:glucosaminidase domain-containing protein [Endozoicomonas gorgoniicola]MCW7551502.1 glucosaminidase domain-containing protein [Endozoicomonas gorgoniicola]
MTTKVDRMFLGLLVIVVLSSSWWHLSQQPLLFHKFIEEVTEDTEPDKPLSGTPDFGSMLDVWEKKASFFAFMKTMVDEENQQLRTIRQQLLSYKNKVTLDESQQQWVNSLARLYKVDEKKTELDDIFDELLIKVDEIPISLALVQAANESAWGTSRFALDANNFFGQWCFSKGCGLVPERRPEGASYEVRKFDSPAHSVRSYMHNLNSSHHYESMREMRMKRREIGEPVTGLILAQGLHAYSIRGVEYVDELVRMIKGNDLLRYDLEGESIAVEH